jgi:hypothetical protein
MTTIIIASNRKAALHVEGPEERTFIVTSQAENSDMQVIRYEGDSFADAVETMRRVMAPARGIAFTGFRSRNA